MGFGGGGASCVAVLLFSFVLSCKTKKEHRERVGRKKKYRSSKTKGKNNHIFFFCTFLSSRSFFTFFFFAFFSLLDLVPLLFLSFFVGRQERQEASVVGEKERTEDPTKKKRKRTDKGRH